MLSGNFVDRKIKKLYLGDKYEPKVSTIYVSLGLNHKFDESYKPYVFFPTKNPIIVDGKEINYLGATIHNFDPKSAPEGKTVMTFMISSQDPKHWIRLRQENKELYDKQKQEVAERVVREADNYFGNIRNNLEVLDVATPATYVRYTNNWNGVPMAWQNTSLYVFKPKKQIKGLKNFYMCGQWVGEPGLPGASMSGKTLAQIICKKENIEFRP
jgi:phytoene dehydrogenase-like protein